MAIEQLQQLLLIGALSLRLNSLHCSGQFSITRLFSVAISPATSSVTP